jgi:putative ABC transport system ATP-binding protein
MPLRIRGVAAQEAERSGRDILSEVGLDARWHHRSGELSGGEQQRVALARALVARPRVLLADEPTGNLDSHSGAEVIALLRELHAAGRTIVLITHDPDVAATATRRIHLHDGRIASIDGEGTAA